MKDSKAWLRKLRAKQDGPFSIIDRREIPEGKCSMCGKLDELRPYGPNYSWVCFDCAMKDEKGAGERFQKVVFGDETH